MDAPKPLTMKRDEIKDFGCWDERVNDLGWEFALIGGVHRDCETLHHSNAQVLHARLEAVDPDQEHWGILRASHWAVGWYDHLIVDPAHAGVMRVLREAREALEDYPVLDEMHLSALELEFHDEQRCDQHCSLCQEG